MDVIQTERLDLIPMTPAFLRAAVRGDRSEAEQILSLLLPTGWATDDADVLALRLKQLEEDPTLQPWLLRAMVLRDSNIMVGHIGFHTAPGPQYLEAFSPGAVEFGFTVFPPYRRNGYAREAAIGLMKWARKSHGVEKFVVSIRPDNVASQGLSRQLGFVRVGSHIDEVDGVEDVLELRVH